MFTPTIDKNIFRCIFNKKRGAMENKIKEINHLDNENRTKELKKILEDNNIRLSHQRLLILDYLVLNHNHPSAEKIYTDLKKVDPVISQATVYNTLNLLTDKRIIRELDFNMVSKRYEFSKQSHGHFICEECESIIDFNVKEQDIPEELKDYDIHTVEIVYRGICHNCKKKTS